MTKSVVLVESLGLGEVVLDSKARTIDGVTLIKSGMSLNRRYYSPELLQSSVPMFEGCRSFADHMTSSERWERSERSIRDITGWYSGVRWQEGCLKGVRHFAGTESGEDAWALASAVVDGTAPKSLAGLSIAIYAHAEEMDGKDEVGNGDPYLKITEIVEVVSVDDVTTPAAGGKYGESLTAAGSWAQNLSYDEWRDLRPEYLERLQTEMKEVRQTKALKEAQKAQEDLQAQLATATESLKTMASQLAEATKETEQVSELQAKVVGLEASLRLERYVFALTLPKVTAESLRKSLPVDKPEEWDSLVEQKRRELQLQPGTKVSVPLGEGNPVTPRTATGGHPMQTFTRIENPDDFMRWRESVIQGGQ